MSGKTNRKHRRNQKDCERYEQCGRREINKADKLTRHQLAHPADTQAHSAGTVKRTAVNYTRKKPLRGLDAYLDKWKVK